MKKFLILCSCLFSLVAAVSAEELPPEESSALHLYAKTLNGKAELVLYSGFYTPETEEAGLVNVIQQSLQSDTEVAEAYFYTEESSVDLAEEEVWRATALLDEAGGNTAVTFELHIPMDTEDSSTLLAAALERLPNITDEEIAEHLFIDVGNPGSSVFGVVIIGDLFGQEDLSDVDASTLYADAIAYVQSEGIVEGYDDGTYRPEAEINRAEFTKILIEAKYPDEEKTGSACLSDIEPEQWYAKYVCFAKEQDIISGYSDGTFRPDQSINLAEALKITLETYVSEIPAVSGAWYEKYLAYAEENALWLDEWENADAKITRGAMAELIYRIEN